MKIKFYTDKGKFYLDKVVQRVKFDLLLEFSKFQKKNPLVTVSLPSLKYPVYIRKNTSDIKTFQQIFHNKEYEINIGFEPKIIFDCGANIGLASVYFKNRYPGAKIIAVEPESSNFELLVKNTKAYGDINCIRSGIWNKTANLKITDKGFGNWGFITEEVPGGGADTVKAISIDELMKKYDVDHIDILKIDIESSEKELFDENFEKWLPKVKVILIELHDYMKEGCAVSFFKAMVNYKFTIRYIGENIICELS